MRRRKYRRTILILLIINLIIEIFNIAGFDSKLLIVLELILVITMIILLIIELKGRKND